MSVAKIKFILRSKGYKIFTRPYEINIVGIRSRAKNPETFDDEFWCFWHNQAGKIEAGMWKGTTDPGTYWLGNPQNPQGTAILKADQYVNCYALGLHKGVSPALVQVKPVTVIRDYDRDAYLDWRNGIEETGMFGINIHRPSGEAKTIGRDSAGCQVSENMQAHLFLMEAATRHKDLYGNSFTYTLIDFRAERRWLVKQAAVASSMAVVAGMAYFNVDKIFTNER